MKKLFRILLIVCSFSFIYLFLLANNSHAAISDLPPYGTNVETWWNTFWANPLSSNYIPLGNVPSPSNIVTLSPGANLQSAVDSLPQTGGTLLLQPGEYSGDIRIYGRNNVHVRGTGANPSDVVLTGTIWVAGCKEASYGYRPDGYDYFVGGIFNNNQYNIDCVTKNRATNIYFYNFTMDAKGRMDPAQNWIEVANGVVFDKIIWQGLTNDPSKVHWGHANGHVMEDNVWFRGNTFKGIYQTAVYLDGCHSCGVIESTIEANFYNSGLIYMDNNDLDYDYNKNGVYDDNELRNGRYLVTAYNNFVPSSNPSVVVTYDWFNTVVLYEGGNVLTLNNSVTANSNEFIYLKGACSYHSPVILDFYDLITKNNILKNGGTKFFLLEHSNQYCNNVGGASTYNLGKYNVSNNVMTKASTGTSFATEISGPITGPNTVSNNCTGTSCPDPRQAIPNRTPSPSPSPTSAATIAPTPIPNVRTGDANNDGKVDMLDYNVWYNNYLASGVMGYTYGDFDNNGRTDGIDYVKWLNNYDTPATPAPTVVATPRPSGSPMSYFPYGVFEDGNTYGGDPKRSIYLSDLRKFKANGIDDIVYTNFTPHADLSDQEGVNIVAAPLNLLNPQWFNNSTVNETIETARSIAYPIVDSYASHPSIKAINIQDDSNYFSSKKLQLMTQAFNERSLPDRPSFPTQMDYDRFIAVNPPVFQDYLYPAHVQNEACDFSPQTILSRFVNNFAQAIQTTREMMDVERKQIPHWMILQTHGFTKTVDPAEPDATKIRVPTPEEVRLQNWIALGEGVDGISWFIWRTQQFWIGLDQNTELWNEVVNLASRVKPLRQTLLTLKKYDFPVYTATSQSILSSKNKPYISSMTNSDKSKWYVIVANHSCSAQNIAVSSTYSNSQLKDVENGTLYSNGQYIPFRGGDGKMFEVVGTVTPPTVSPSVNIVTNPSFESGSGTVATGWNQLSGITRDTTTAKSGTASLKFSSPLNSNYTVIPISGLKPNTQYSISYWVKANSATGTGVGIRYAHISPNMGFSPTPMQLQWINGTTNGFQQAIGTFYTFEGMTQGRFDLEFELTGGTAWIDDITICEGHLGCGGTFQY